MRRSLRPFGLNLHCGLDMNNKLFSTSILLLASLCLLTNAHAVERARGSVTSFDNAEPAANFFQAIDGGLIEVKFIAPNAQHANVLIQNKTDQVLHVKLPDAFAAVPILSQKESAAVSIKANNKDLVSNKDSVRAWDKASRECNSAA